MRPDLEKGASVVTRGFNVRSMAGWLDEFGLLLPLGLGLMLFNGLNPPGLFFATGLLTGKEADHYFEGPCGGVGAS